MGENHIKDIGELFKSIYDDSPIGIGISDLDGGLIDLNHSFMELFGVLNKKDIIGFNLVKRLNIPKENLNNLKKRTTVSHELLFDFDVIKEQKLFETTNSGKIYIDVLITPLFLGGSKSIFNYLVYIQDISGCKITEQNLNDTKAKLKEENENLFNVLNTIGSGVYVVNSQYDVVFINPALERELGLLNGKKCFEYFLNRSNPCPNCRNFSVFEGKTISQEFYSSKVNKVYEITSTPLSNPDGTVSKLGIFYDITDRKKTEDSLREREISYKKLTENLPGLVYRVLAKDNNRMIFFNDLLESLTGYQEEEILHGEVCSIDPLIYFEDRDNTISEVKKAVKNNLSFNIEYRLIHKSGEIRWISESGSPIYEENGDLFSIDGVIFDITERKIAEEKLKASERCFRGIFDNASHGLALIKPNGRFITFNKKAATMLGYSTDELNNETPLSVTHPDDLKKSQEKLDMLLNGNISSYRIEKRYLTKNEKEFWADLSVRALYDDNGSINAILGILVDINERKKAEMKLKKSEDKYRNLISNIMDIIVEIDLNGYFLYTSPQVYNILGYNPEEVIGANGFNLVHPDDQQRVKLILRDAVKSKDHIYLEFKTLHKKGNYIDVSAHGRVASVDGIDKVFLVIRDISARKLAVKVARESQQLLEHTFNALNDAVFILNTENPPTILKCNLTAERIFGYSIKEMLERPTSFLHINMQSLEKFQQILYPIIKRGEVFTDFKYRMKRKNGSVFPSEHSVLPLKNESGKRIGWVSVVRDLTKQMEAEQKLQESEEKYRHIFDNSPLGIGITNLEGTVIAMNKKMEELTGYNINELNDLGLENDYVNPDIRNQLIEKIKEQGFIRDYEVKKKHRDGSTYLALLNVDLIDIHGEPLLHTTVRDITFQKLAEKKLKETEHKFRSFVESTPVATFLYQDYKCIYANPAAINLTENSLEELYALKFWDFVHPEYRKIVIKIGNALEKNQPFTFVNDIKIITKSGSEKWINGNMVLIRYEGKRAALISAIDITEKKEAEQRLIRSEEIYRNFIQNFQGIAFQGYIDFSIGFFHGAVEEITGYQLNDFTSEKIRWDQIIYPNDIQVINEKIKAFYSSKRQSDAREYRIVRKDGDIRWVLENCQKIYDPKKNMEGVQGLIVDITERKIAEQKLQQSEDKYRTLFDNAPFAIVVFNIEGDILDCNEAVSKITGYKKTELLGRNFKEFEFYKDNQAALVEKRQRSVNIGIIPAPREVLLNKKDKTQFWARSYIDFIQLGKDTYIQAIIQDITERKKAREELDKLSKIKAELLTRTSHELKTPAMHIKGYADLLLHKSKANLNEEELNIIRHIKKGVLRLETLIYDILHKAELESGSSELNMIENNLSSLIELSVRELDSFAALRGHSINLNIHRNMKIKFDRDQIRHVINNLITNAIKYTPLNGRIEISSEIDEDFATIAIHDNGIGIIENEKDRLFSQFGKIERFGQGFEIITEGSGLGLYIAKKIIDLHGGKIWVESEGRNKGSTFYFSLPIFKD